MELFSGFKLTDSAFTFVKKQIASTKKADMDNFFVMLFVLLLVYTNIGPYCLIRTLKLQKMYIQVCFLHVFSALIDANQYLGRK